MKGSETNGNMTVYEIGFHILPFVGDQGVSHEVGEIKALLEKGKAEIISEDFPRLRPLAYPLSKVLKGEKKVCKEAYFGWIKFEMDSGSIEDFKVKIEKQDNILRFLIIKTVRENTLYGAKFVTRTEKAPRKEETQEEKGPINPEELDKSIDELVV